MPSPCHPVHVSQCVAGHMRRSVQESLLLHALRHTPCRTLPCVCRSVCISQCVYVAMCVCRSVCMSQRVYVAACSCRSVCKSQCVVVCCIAYITSHVPVVVCTCVPQCTRSYLQYMGHTRLYIGNTTLQARQVVYKIYRVHRTLQTDATPWGC